MHYFLFVVVINFYTFDKHYHISSSETSVFLVQKHEYISEIKFSGLNLIISLRTPFSDNNSF